MKKLIGLMLTAAMLCAFASCGTNNSSKQNIEVTTAATQAATEQAATEQAATEQATAEPAVLSAETEAALKETIEGIGFEGVIYAEKNGSAIVSFAKGTTENGKNITIDTPLPIGSVSKQFCAAAVLLLQEQGKLSVNDKLDKFYPGYSEGKKISVHNLLSMRAGIPEMTAEGNEDLVTADNTEEENNAAIKEWLFAQPLDAEPDSSFVYTNLNYFLLSDIVSQVSGKKYIDFLRESFFAPLGMKNTGSIIELPSNPEWTQGVIYEHIDLQPGITNGCGDIISNAADMTIWMNALSGGRVVSPESYKAMTANYSPEAGYGYGMFTGIKGGVGHYGAIGDYSAFDYINTENGFTMFAASNSIDPTDMYGVSSDLLDDLME